MDYYVEVQHLGETAATRPQNANKTVSEIQCIIFKQNIVNPYKIYNICVEISIVLHSRIIFREKENLISASNVSDLMHN